MCHCFCSTPRVLQTDGQSVSHCSALNALTFWNISRTSTKIYKNKIHKLFEYNCLHSCSRNGVWSVVKSCGWLQQVIHMMWRKVYTHSLNYIPCQSTTMTSFICLFGVRHFVRFFIHFVLITIISRSKTFTCYEKEKKSYYS